MNKLPLDKDSVEVYDRLQQILGRLFLTALVGLAFVILLVAFVINPTAQVGIPAGFLAGTLYPPFRYYFSKK